MAATPDRMIASNQRLYTVAEFEQMPESNERYELIKGSLVEKPMPKPDHNRVVRRMLRLYDQFDPPQKKGEMLQETNFRLSKDYAPTPDISFWQVGHEPAPGSNSAPIPDLAIEVQSPGRSLKELSEKALDYIGGGVKLVWVIQPSQQRVGIFRPGKIESQMVGINDELGGEDVVSGFKIAVKALFE